MKTQIYFVLGPTASGKSKFALSLANILNGEIINADSMQIYNELSILTARPTINDQKKINHHLYGFVKGDVRFNVQKWCEEASKKINYLVNKNITPILGQAPEAWADLPEPDAIFIGGSGRHVSSIVEKAYQRLKPNGRLLAVVGSVDGLSAVSNVLGECNGELQVKMINIARGVYQLEKIRLEGSNPSFLISTRKP